jgi:ArsR family transcriptional regulator, zinc-responsive transcriptional repressor
MTNRVQGAKPGAVQGAIQGATDQDLEQLTSLFRLLSDKTRLNILMLLTGGERNVSNLCDALKLPQPTVSHHLGLLRLNNVIGNRRSGKQVFYNLNGRVDVGDGTSLQIRSDHFEITINPRERSEATSSAVEPTQA